MQAFKMTVDQKEPVVKAEVENKHTNHTVDVIKDGYVVGKYQIIHSMLYETYQLHYT